MPVHPLQDFVLVFGLSLAVVFVFGKIRVPPVIGFLLTGVLVGPHGLGLVRGQHNVEVLAEVGIAILLFAIGVEVSFSEMVRMWRMTLIGGSLQVGITVALGTIAAAALGLDLGSAFVVGMALALSSTAIALRLLHQQDEVAAPHGRAALGILLFQDLAVVPMLVILPFIAGDSEGWRPLGWIAISVIAVLGAVALASFVVPRVLEAVVASRSREAFLLTVIVLCLGTAWMTATAGLSLALGAFLAGLLVSRSEYGLQALSAIVPFRDAFGSLFFVSMGMLLDVRVLADQTLPVVATSVAILVGKTVIVAGIITAMGHPLRIALAAGLLLAQIGEFSFLLFHQAVSRGLLSGGVEQVLMAATVLTMTVTPLAAGGLPRLLGRLKATWPRGARTDAASALSEHVIIVGYGVAGNNVARVLEQAGTEHEILELNPATVRRERRQGKPIRFGDAVHQAVLEHVGIERARVLVLTIPNPVASRQIVQLARQLQPSLHIVVRTRFVAEVAELHRLGANEVVPEEFETSIEIASRVLRSYLMPRHKIDALVRLIREEDYEPLRAETGSFRPVEGLQRLLGGVQLEAYAVTATSLLAGRTLAEVRLRQSTGVLVLAVHRDGVTTPSPDADWQLAVDDVALVLGPPAALAEAGRLFHQYEPKPEAE